MDYLCEVMWMIKRRELCWSGHKERQQPVRPRRRDQFVVISLQRVFAI
jgi:hypothetical protein